MTGGFQPHEEIVLAPPLAQWQRPGFVDVDLWR
jgi:hypothetical protein